MSVRYKSGWQEGLDKYTMFKILFNMCENSKDEICLTIQNIMLDIDELDRRMVAGHLLNDITALFVAVRKHKIKTAKFLLEVCLVDVDQMSICRLYGGRKHAMTALWCACYRGDLEMAKMLIQHGANVNKSVKGKFTPVMAACNSLNLQLVTYLVENGADLTSRDEHGDTCLMNAVTSLPLCQYLTDKKVDLNLQNHKGDTAMHQAVHDNQLETVKLLVESGADFAIINNVGQDALRLTCLKGLMPIFEYLLAIYERYFMDKWIRANALELMASTFILNGQGNTPPAESLEFLHRALVLRQNEDGGISPKYYSRPMQYRRVFEGVTEFNTEEELNRIKCSPYAMKVQAVMIMERVLGPSIENIMRVMDCGINLEYTNKGNAEAYQHSFDMYLYAFWLINKKFFLTSTFPSWPIQAIINLFLDIRQHFTMISGVIKFNRMFKLLELITVRLPKNMKMIITNTIPAFCQKNFNLICDTLVFCLFRLISEFALTKTELDRLKGLLRRMVKANLRTFNNDTLLHLAVKPCLDMVYKTSANLCQMYFLPDTKVIDLLIECGHHVDAINCKAETPLHVAAKAKRMDVFMCLLGHRAHVDQTDAIGMGPSDYLDKAKFNSFPYLSLKCLAAKVVADYQIPYKGNVPHTLECFIQQHYNYVHKVINLEYILRFYTPLN